MKTIKKFIGYYRPYKKILSMDIFCAVVMSLIDIAFPQILRHFTNTVFLRSPDLIITALWQVAIILLLTYGVKYLCEYFVTSWGHIMGAHMEGDMRRELFEHYQKLSFSYYDNHNTGEMVSKLVSDLFDISELAHHGPENIVISVLTIIGSIALLMMIHVPLTLIICAVTLIMVIFSIFKNKQMRRVFDDNRKKIAQVNTQVQDSLLGIKIVKSFANEQEESRKFSRSNEDFFHSKSSSYKIMGVFYAGNAFFNGLLYLTVLVAGGYFVTKGAIAPQDLAIYALYIGIFINPVSILIRFSEMFQKGFSGFRRFIGIIETTPEIVDKKDALLLKDIKGDVSFQNVTFSYETGGKVLEDVTLFIPSGKTIALVGPSGGGKTTLCSLIPRFYDVSDGSIKIDGMDIRDITLTSLRANIGIVQQDVYLFGGTLRDNIAYGKVGATDEEVIDAAKKANIHDFIMSLPHGYNTEAGERGTRLSGGQKQRISIARVFLKNPGILILDEATSSLDNESEMHIQRALETLSKGRTTIVIAHRLSTIKNAEEIYVVADKKIKENGTHDTLMEKGGLYAKYYNMQFIGIDDIV